MARRKNKSRLRYSRRDTLRNDNLTRAYREGGSSLSPRARKFKNSPNNGRLVKRENSKSIRDIFAKQERSRVIKAQAKANAKADRKASKSLKRQERLAAKRSRSPSGRRKIRNKFGEYLGQENDIRSAIKEYNKGQQMLGVDTKRRRMMSLMSDDNVQGADLIDVTRTYQSADGQEQIIYTNKEPINKTAPVRGKYVTAVMIFMILFFVPVVMGFAVNLINNDIDEAPMISTPNDVNTFQWVNGDQGSCTTTRSASSLVDSYFDEDFGHDLIGYNDRDGVQMSTITNSGTSTERKCGQDSSIVGSDEFKIQLPSLLFNSNDVARFELDFIDKTGCQCGGPTWTDSELEFDWWVTLDGEYVFGDHVKTDDSYLLSTQYSSGITTNEKYHNNWLPVNYSLSLLDQNVLGWAATSSTGHVIVFHWDNYTAQSPSVGQYAAHSVAGENIGLIFVETHGLETFNTQSDTRALLSVMAIIIAYIGVACTTWHNPVVGWLKQVGVSEGGKL